MRRMRWLPHLSLMAVTLVWGTTFPLVKRALLDSSPLAFNLVRMAIAAGVLLTLNHRRLRGMTRRDLRAGALAGVLLALGYQLQTAGLAYTSAAKSAFLTGLVVVLVPLLSMIPGLAAPGSRKPGVAAFGGTVLAFAGIIFLTTPPGSAGTIFSGLHRGEWLTLACSLAYGFHLLAIDRTAAHSPARRLGTLQISFAALTMLVTLTLGGPPHIRFTGPVLLALAVTAVLATAVAFTVQSWAQQHLPATHTALIFTFEPIFAWLFSLLFLGEHLSHRSMLGAGLILAGILLAELWPTRPANSGILPTAEL